MIINPLGAEFIDWARAVSQQLGLRGDTVAVTPDMEWSDWASRILRLPQIAGQGAARPDHYNAWLAWAYDFNRSVEY
jgi:hypothetical protein